MAKRANPPSLGKFYAALKPAERKSYARALRSELKDLGNAYQVGWMSKNAVPSVRMVGDVLGTLSAKGKSKGYSMAGTPTVIPPMPPFSPEQWMRAAASAAWAKFPERAASVGLNPAPYPTASTQFDAPDAPSAPTHTESVVSAQRVMQYLLARFNPVRGLTPNRLGTYLEQWSLGFLRWLSLSWNQIRERDDMIKTVMTKREFAVARLDWEILMDDDSPEAKQHKEALQYFYDNLSCTDALDQNTQGGIQLLIRTMMRAIGDKFAVHEIVWQPTVDETGKPQLSAHFRFIPLWFFENRTGQLRYLPYELALDGIPLDAGGWLVTVGDGLNFAMSIAYIYKQLGLKSYANFVDKYAMPFVIGKTNASYGSDEWNQMVSAVAGIRSDGSLVTNLQSTLESLKIEAPGGATIPQEQFLERMDRAIARLARGGDLSTMSRAGSGVGALPQISQEDEIAEADANLLSEACHFYVDRWVLRYLFGTDSPKARFQITPPSSTDTAKEIAIDTFLIGNGVPLGVIDARKRYNRQEPKQGEEVMQPAAQAQVDDEAAEKDADSSGTSPLSLGNGETRNRIHRIEQHLGLNGRH